jgi:hypothetical protein
VVGGLHLVYPGKDNLVADNVMGNEGAVLNVGIIPNVAGNNSAVPDARRDIVIVMPQEQIPQYPQAYEPVKIGIPYQCGIKGIGYQKVFPVGAEVIVLNQDFYFLDLEPAPGSFFLSGLFIPQPILILSRREIGLGNKVITVTLRGFI